ncbi:MAG TPA: GNAT family N-acetyltransferase [Caldisericia bacterium]|nr:GNAT family N-acetyltransferase [Caldisericia bacterium]
MNLNNLDTIIHKINDEDKNTIFQIASSEEIDKLINEYPHVKQVICTGENSYTLFAYKNSRVFAFMSVFRREIEVPIKGLVEDFINVIDIIDVSQKRQGYGSKLIGIAKSFAQQDGIFQIRAYCEVSNTASLALWNSNGFSLNPIKVINGIVVGCFAAYRF